MGSFDGPAFTALALVSGALSLPPEAVRGQLVESVELIPGGEAYRSLEGTGLFHRLQATPKHRVTLEVAGVAGRPSATGSLVVGEVVRMTPASPGLETADYRVVSFSWRWREAQARGDWRLVLEEV